MVVCPFCKGEINDDATKCKHCGEWTPLARNRIVKNDKKLKKRGCGCLVVAIIFLVIIFNLPEKPTDIDGEKYLPAIGRLDAGIEIYYYVKDWSDKPMLLGNFDRFEQDEDGQNAVVFTRLDGTTGYLSRDVYRSGKSYWIKVED